MNSPQLAKIDSVFVGIKIRGQDLLCKVAVG